MTDLWRKNADHAGINKVHQKSKIYEIQFCEKLQSIFPDLKTHFDRIETGSPTDFKFFLNDSPTPIYTLELEVGADYWKDQLPTKGQWYRGLSILERKMIRPPEKLWDVFIKHSKTLNSFFATTYDFAKNNTVYQPNAPRKRMTEIAYGRTCESYFAVPWEKTSNQEGLCIDNFELLEQMIRKGIQNKVNQLIIQDKIA